ncbi:MAG TPA: hypothetical protein VGM77_12230 [Gemmatimonadales bacterium]|jgi:hypothetical protein
MNIPKRLKWFVLCVARIVERAKVAICEHVTATVATNRAANDEKLAELEKSLDAIAAGLKEHFK